MIYEALLLIGGVGIAAQAALGFAHVGGAHTGHHFQGGDVHGHAHVHLHFGGGEGGHSASGHNHPEGHDVHAHASANGNMLGNLWALLSPLTIFSLCLGAGAAGLGAQATVKNSTLVALIAVLGALAFYGLIVRPLWRLIFAFASKPAETLAGAVTREAEAAGRFDSNGRGIVTVTVDGQLVRLLAHLPPDERSQAREIAPGDRLVVTAVDNRRNTCTVTKL